MSRAFVDGVLTAGLDVVDIGLASTDQLWFASGPARAARARCSPPATTRATTTESSSVCATPPRSVPNCSRRSRGARWPRPPPAAETRGTLTEQDLLPDYAAHLHSLVDLAGNPPADRVVVDAGNGMAGHTLPAVLGGQNLELVGLYTDLDGSFPNHQPNPLEPENLVDAQAAVLEHGADLALVFDGDADRCFVIDERGEVVNPSTITAMIASRSWPASPAAAIVICNKITSGRCPRSSRERGGKIVITQVGPHVRQGRDGRARGDLRRRALRALLLPRVLGRRHRHAGRAARAGRCWAAPASRCRSSAPQYSRFAPRARSTPPSPTPRAVADGWPRTSPAAAGSTASTG